jgi:serralysin
LLIAYDTISGFEAVTGGSGNETVRGNAGANFFRGEIGNDMMLGEAGQETLVGGAGDDVLTGGADADRFDFAGGSGHDSILDFEDGLDLIRFCSGPDSMADLILAGSAILYRMSSITLVGVDATSLTAADFIFA